MICGSATEKMRTSDFRRRTSAGLRGHCMRRSRSARVARRLKSEVTDRGSGTLAASALARHCEATGVSLPRVWRAAADETSGTCGTNGTVGNARGLSPASLLAVSCDGEFYVPIYGGNGNIMGYVDESGAFAAKFVYDPYGDVISIEGGPSAPMPSPDGSPVPIPVGRSGEDFSFGFSTKYHDREVGLVAYQLRSYSPRLGRWLNRDPIEEDGGVNLYGFCLNNAILYYDAKGESFEDFSNFCAGIGDSLTLGITRLLRRGINRMTDGTWDDYVNVGTSAYMAGEVTEVTVEIVVTLGGAILRQIAKRTSRKVVEGGARAAYRRAHGLVGKGGEVHHINPIKGHPYGKSARYPLPFEWAARGDWNMTWYATKAEHRAAHARMMFLETIDGYRETTILVRQTGNEIINYLSASPDARCFDSLEIRTTILPLEHDLTGIHFNAVPASVTIQINQKGERLCPH